MNDGEQDPRLRVRAAAAAAQYVRVEKGDGGKTDEAMPKRRRRLLRAGSPLQDRRGWPAAADEGRA